MQRIKLGIGFLLFVTLTAVISSQSNAQIFFFDFDSDSGFASGQGIGASQTVRADAFNIVTVSTVDIFAPEFADDGTGNFAPTGNTLFASAGDEVTTQTRGAFLGIDNPSVSNAEFFAGAGIEFLDLNDGEGWVVEFDVDVSFRTLNLSSVLGGTLTVNIEGIGSFDLTDVATAGEEFIDPFGADFIPAGTDITFAYSAPATEKTATLRINSFTVCPAVIFDGVGDINQDTFINFFDIPAFIAILASGDNNPIADLNFDGEVTFEDIPPFIAILASI